MDPTKITRKTHSNWSLIKFRTMRMKDYGNCNEKGEEEPGDTNYGIGGVIWMRIHSPHDNYKRVDGNGLA
jgi:hypothetical protein